ncbi:MAG TPA: hypothetical protein VNN72_00890 [Polyangiaceae bacterium]|nr:hypothetical protein [Polyangiaceae bacterium]
MRLWSAFVLTFLLVSAPAFRAQAWIFPEHRDIANAALDELTPQARAAWDRLWAEARACFAAPLCEKVAAGEQGLEPSCVDFGAWPALAGDHSCSPKDLVESVLPSNWVLPVAKVAALTKADIAAAGSREEKINRIATSNLRLQGADTEYASRATSNIAHFLLPRKTDDVVTYMQSALAAGAPLNAIGIYLQQHLAAIAAAQQFATAPPKDPKERAELIRRILGLEAYALHWLEDTFAAGHVVGTWGSTAWRKGTHDYYNEYGYAGRRWNGEPIVLFGDANMRKADLERAAAVVASSLEQVARALTPGDPLGVASLGFGLGPEGAYTFDACNQLVQPGDSGGNRAVLVAQMTPILFATPIPGRGEGDVHVPRFREELGPFLGVFGAVGGGVSWGGLVSSGARGSAALAAGVRLGFGAESLTGTPGTATAFLEGGIQMTAAEADQCTGASCQLVGTSNLFPASPARTGLRLGVRMPFWVLPGDVLVLGPVLALVAPHALSDVGVAAASGGLIPYERTVQTGIGSFQIIAGREVQGTLFGYLGPANLPLYIAPISKNPDGTPVYGVVSEKSLAFAFPVVEWTPFRAFATQLTFTTAVQLGFGVEVPLSTEVVYPENAAAVKSPPSWTIFLRGQFDGRYFLGANENLPPGH